MSAMLVTTLLLAAIGLIGILNLVLAFSGVGTVELSPLKVGLLALVIGAGVGLLR